MRNLKKVLALVLALVMSLSLVTIANASDFADADEITYEEAVDVMSTIGVFEGFEDSSFKPEGTLTREQAAKIITYMLLGENADRLSVSSSRYSDVAATRWSAPAIEYCSTLGIITGNGDGTYSPTSHLTGYAFAKMLLTALGYDAKTEGFTGMGWTINVTRLATQVGLDNGIETLNWGTGISREEACQMALNAVKSPLVAYDGGNTIVIDGTEVSFGSGDAYYVTTTIAKEQRISTQTLSNTGDYTVEFGERYFPKLELDYDVDDFGRPAYTWIYDSNEICTYVDTDLLYKEYTTEVTGKDLYDLLGASTIKNYEVAVYVDGETDEAFLDDAYFTTGNLVRTNTNTVGETGNGVLTQVFVDTQAKEVTIAIINTYLAVADNDYDSKKDELDLTVYSIDDKDSSAKGYAYVKDTTETEPFTVSGEDFDIADYVDGDIVLVTVAQGVIQTVSAPETIDSAVIDAFKVDSYVETDGTEYKYADTISYDPAVLDDYTGISATPNLKDLTYNLILDPYGYLVGIEQNEDPDVYLFLVGMNASASNFTGTTAEANVIFMDGTMATIDINTKKSMAADGTTQLVDNVDAVMNTWCTYTVNSSDVYTLTEVGSTLGDVAQSHDNTRTEIDKSHISLDGAGTPARVYGNDESVYLVVETDLIDSDSSYHYYTTGAGTTDDAAVIDDVISVVTGVENADIEVYNNTKVESLYTMQVATNSGNTTKTYANVSYGTYVLYDEDAYVIGAVVVGEDAGSTSNFVYVTSANANRERYSSTDDEYTWTREVIVDGELTEISYVGDTLDEIGNTASTGNMQQGNWYYVRYYADGTVKDTKTIVDGDNGYDVETTIQAAVNEIDANNSEHVLLNEASESGLRFQNGTLYSDVDYSKGIWVSPDVKVVRAQTVDGKAFDEVEYYDGRDGLEDALDDLGVTSTGSVEVSAIIEDGAAMVIILNNTNDSITDEGETEVDADIMADIDTDPTDVTITYIGANAPDFDECAAAIEAEIEKTGYEVTTIEQDSSDADKYVFTAVKGKITKTYTYDSSATPTRVAKVNWTFTDANPAWSFTMKDAYVAYTGSDITGTLTYTSAPGADDYTISSVTVTGAAFAAVKTQAAFNGSELSHDIVFTVGVCTADEITLTLNGVTTT